MVQVTHEECPYCGHKDCYSYNTELNVYNCFSCGRRGRLTWEPEEEEEGLSLEPYIPDSYRGISRATMEKFGVYFTKQDGKETVHWKYPNGTKHRELPKNIRSSGKLDGFYGQDDYNSGGQYITITEGEEDRLSVIEMMGNYPCVSVPGANPSKDFWANAQKYLSGFNNIKLSLDNDDAGNKLAEKFYRMFPGKVYRVSHSKYKDANDFLGNGATKEYKQAWWNAQKVKPDSILCTYDDFVNLYNHTPDYEYFATGIPELDKKMLGIHKSAVTLILAETGLGKTEVMRYLEYQALKNTDYTIAFCHGEETKLRSILGLFSYYEGLNLTRKDLVDKNGREGQYKDFVKWFTSGERVYQFEIEVEDDVDDIIDKIRFMSEAMGVDYFFIEPVQDFVSGPNTSEKESKLTDLFNKMKRLAPKLNIGIVVIAHANKEGEAKYAASISQSAGYEINLQRDRDNEDPEEANRTYVYVGRKNRTGGGSGPAGVLTFDLESFTLTPDLGPQEPVFDNTESSKVVGF